MEYPKISIVIPFFNRIRFLKQSLLSVFNEGYPNKEIILVDDGSSDGSASLASTFPINLIQHKERKGPSSARNSGLNACTGEFVTFLDSDDLLLPGAIGERLAFLNRVKTEAVLGCLGDSIDENGDVIKTSSYKIQSHFKNWPANLSLDFFSRNSWLPPAVLSLLMIRRTLIKKVGSFEPGLNYGEDRDFLFRLLKHTALSFFPIPCVSHRLHDSNSAFLKNGELNRKALALTYIIDRSFGLDPLGYSV